MADEILGYSALNSDRKRKKITRKNVFTGLEMPEGASKNRKRVGRGRSSGMGKTSSRGSKGQKARAGYSRRAGFEGGQNPLHRRLPKRGFRNIFSIEYQVVNLWRLEKESIRGTIGPIELEKQGFIRASNKPVKVLGQGEIKGAINITADAFSEGAKAAIEKAGGTCTLRVIAVSVAVS
jgi:large subunit ribosomal protein L15